MLAVSIFIVATAIPVLQAVQYILQWIQYQQQNKKDKKEA